MPWAQLTWSFQETSGGGEVSVWLPYPPSHIAWAKETNWCRKHFWVLMGKRGTRLDCPNLSTQPHGNRALCRQILQSNVNKFTDKEGVTQGGKESCNTEGCRYKWHSMARAFLSVCFITIHKTHWDRPGHRLLRLKLSLVASMIWDGHISRETAVDSSPFVGSRSSPSSPLTRPLLRIPFCSCGQYSM